MKKNIITIILLLVYTITFVVLFIRLRSLSGVAMEELVEKNIYYILGFMFISGISVVFYLFLSASSNEDSIVTDDKSDNFYFTEGNADSNSENKVGNKLDQLKIELTAIFESNSGSEKEKTEKLIGKLCNHFEISQALLYLKEADRDQLTLKVAFAFVLSENEPKFITVGEGLTGQAVLEKMPYYIKDVPEGYLKVISGLGESIPKTLLIIPCEQENEVKAVFELSSLQEYSKNTFDDIVSICKYVSNLLTK